MIGIWQRFDRNFELTVFELTVPDCACGDEQILSIKLLVVSVCSGKSWISNGDADTRAGAPIYCLEKHFAENCIVIKEIRQKNGAHR